jgi:Bacterial Ig-like domain/L,D-transpeptidase catalytic domain
MIGIAAALVVLIGAGGVYYFANASKASSAAPGGGSSKPGKHVVVPVKGPEQIAQITPADGSTDVNGGAPITVQFTKPLSPTSPMPTLKPAIKGSWKVSGDTATFTPAAGYWQQTKVTINVPAGPTGVVSSAEGRLATPSTASFTTGSFSEVRLEQLLAQLGYLPLTWAPASGTPAALSDANAQYQAAYAPPTGSYTWQSGYPTHLESMWKPDAPSEILRGAVAAFQADHDLIEDMITENQQGLIVTGSIGHRLWKAMFKAIKKDDTNKHGYTYAFASQHYPETLTVWHNGTKIFHHLANTGIPVSPTSPGTNPVYIRYQSQIMKGTNPDGSKYADQVYWVAYFHEGEAVHYFLRASYGSQQSLGCVELPYNEAKKIWPYLTYGTLVTVTKV